MRRTNRFTLFIVFVSVVANVFAQKPNNAKSEWAYYDSKGKLVYKILPSGDRIMDFSYAGYMGGGVNIPDVKVKLTVSPAKGDNTDAIQNCN